MIHINKDIIFPEEIETLLKDKLLMFLKEIFSISNDNNIWKDNIQKPIYH
jgi:hypothetical protein